MTTSDNNSNNAPGITRKIIFRITTGITIIGMLLGGLSQLLRTDNQVATFEQLDYPLYVLSIIGLGKILGAVALSIPGVPPLFKISAYAGLVFVTIGAVASHLVTGAPLAALPPFIVAVIAIVSCFLNPDFRFATKRTPADSKSNKCGEY